MLSSSHSFHTSLRFGIFGVKSSSQQKFVLEFKANHLGPKNVWSLGLQLVFFSRVFSSADLSYKNTNWSIDREIVSLEFATSNVLQTKRHLICVSQNAINSLGLVI